MSLKPINIIQAAESDIRRKLTNSSPPYEQYAFYRKHVRKAKNVRQLLLMALMSPPIKMVVPKGEDIEVPRLDTIKRDTKLIYGNAGLLVEALKLKVRVKMGRTND